MNRVSELLGIRYPIIQGGMIWHSGWKLASAVSNQGGLGLLGAGSMYPDVLKEHIQKCKLATNKAFGVNLPLLYPNIEEHIQIILEEKIPVVFTSAGNPKTWTETLQKEGIKVIHVVSSVKFGLKCQDAGVDAVVGEGFEAGGHNGREETTTLCLIPDMKKNLHIPIIAAGGIATGSQMAAAFCVGAEAVQIGSRFAATVEASSHDNFKHEIVKAKEGDTKLMLKELTPVRLLKNPFFEEIEKLYSENASIEQLRQHLGRARAKKGMFEGNITEGELEIGQCASLIDEILTVEQVFELLLHEFNQTKRAFTQLEF